MINVELVEQFFFECKLNYGIVPLISFDLVEVKVGPRDPVMIRNLETVDKYVPVSIILYPIYTQNKDEIRESSTKFLSIECSNRKDIKRSLLENCCGLQYNYIEGLSETGDSFVTTANLVADVNKLKEIFKPMEGLLEQYDTDIRFCNLSMERILTSSYVLDDYYQLARFKISID